VASAADVYGPTVLGVVLSSRLRDRREGLRQIRRAGGRGVIQAPETAEAAGMPVAAMGDGVLRLRALSPRELQAALAALVAVPGAAELLSVRGHPATAAAAFSPSQI
jgi:two-component system chemotaxis response regulator CheB